MSKRTCSYHTADRSFHHPIFHLTFSKQCQIRHIKCIRARQGGFVTSAKSNAKALSTAVPSIKSTLAPCGVQDVRGTSVLHRPKRSEDLFFPAIGVLPTSHLQPFLVCHLYRSVPRPCHMAFKEELPSKVGLYSPPVQILLSSFFPFFLCLNIPLRRSRLSGKMETTCPDRRKPL